MALYYKDFMASRDLHYQVFQAEMLEWFPLLLEDHPQARISWVFLSSGGVLYKTVLYAVMVAKIHFRNFYSGPEVTEESVTGLLILDSRAKIPYHGQPSVQGQSCDLPQAHSTPNFFWE